MVSITGRDDLWRWLGHVPREWAQIIAVRAALRVAPLGLVEICGSAAPDHRDGVNIAMLRASIMAWTARNCPADNTAGTSAADAKANEVGAYVWAYGQGAVYPDDAYTAAFAAAAAASAEDDDVLYAAARATSRAAAAAVNAGDIWLAIAADCTWLDTHGETPQRGAQLLSFKPLWLSRPPRWFGKSLNQAKDTLLQQGAGYDIWVEWLDRRVRGRKNAWLGAERRAEDEALQIRIAQQPNFFWENHAATINQAIARWRAEAEPKATLSGPLPRVRHALGYGVNARGRLSRSPVADQEHLQDNSDQLLAYNNIRAALEELKKDGQQLGPKLPLAIDRLLLVMPDAFEAALAYDVWHAALRLRVLFMRHEAVKHLGEADEYKLDRGVAVELGAILKIYNRFALHDDNLRMIEEEALSPEERRELDALTEATRPIDESILQMPQVAEAEVLEDIRREQQVVAEADDQSDANLAKRQANRNGRSRLRGVLNSMQPYLKLTGENLAKGAISEVGKKFTDDAPDMARFVAENAEKIVRAAEKLYNEFDWSWISEIFRNHNW